MKHHTPSSKHYSPPLLHAADYLLGIGMSIFAQAYVTSGIGFFFVLSTSKFNNYIHGTDTLLTCFVK